MSVRSVGFIQSWYKGTLIQQKPVYTPGTHNPSTILPGRKYTGRVTRIDASYKLRYRGKGKIKLLKDGEETILNRFDIPGGTGVLNLIDLISSLSTFSVNDGESILVEVEDTSTFLQDDFLSVSGDAAEDSIKLVSTDKISRFKGVVTDVPLIIFPENIQRLSLVMVNNGESEVYISFGETATTESSSILPGWYFISTDEELLNTGFVSVVCDTGKTSTLEGIEN